MVLILGNKYFFIILKALGVALCGKKKSNSKEIQFLLSLEFARKLA